LHAAALLHPVMGSNPVMGRADLDSTYAGLRQAVAWRVVARDGVIVSGPGARDWLQGQLSQDISTLGDEVHSRETLILSPQGKIDCYSRVAWMEDDAFLLDVRSGYGELLLERLRRFKLRVKADLELVDDLQVAELRGPGLQAGGSTTVDGTREPLAVIAVDWPGWCGRDVVFRAGGVGIDASLLGLGALGSGADEAFEAARIEAGVPELGVELTDRTIPQEAGDLVAHTVSFTKGCYTGQELVARIDARGSNTPRRLRGLVIEHAGPDAGPGGGDAIVTDDGDKVGEVTSVAWAPGRGAHVALGYLRRGIDVPASVVVESTAQSDDGGRRRRASARPLPLFGA